MHKNSISDILASLSTGVSGASSGTQGNGFSSAALVPAAGNFGAFDVELLAAGFPVQRVSVASDGTQGNSFSTAAVLSADGNFVSFDSDSTNLVPGDTNGSRDVFVFDRQTNTTERISVASDGTEANDLSGGSAISSDGRFVTYVSFATNLISGDTNSVPDVFLFDRQTHTTERISVASDGTEGNGMSGETPAISGDGRFVTYASEASNLVAGDTNGSEDIFVFDRQTHTTERVSVASDGSEANGFSFDQSISADGRYVTFLSWASNLVAGDTNGLGDIFVFDRQTNTTERVSVASDGTEGNSVSFDATISPDGRYVTYASEASNLVPGDTNNTFDIFVFDRQTHTTERISVASDGTQANDQSQGPTISADNRFVTYFSNASNLVSGDTNGTADIFVYDRVAHTTTRLSVAADGTEANGFSQFPSISADGHEVIYTSLASNLVPGDTNDVSDVFLAQIGPVTPPVDGVVKDGDDGDNILTGTPRDDILRGHGGNDQLFGGKGNDILDGGTGNDLIDTGKGLDQVIFNEGDGQDVVVDFEHQHKPGDQSFDRVQLNVSIGSNTIDDFDELAALVASGDVGMSTDRHSLTLTFDNGDALTLQRVTALAPEDWAFA